MSGGDVRAITELQFLPYIDDHDIPAGINFARGIDGLTGIIIIKGSDIGLWGDIKVCPLQAPEQDSGGR